MWKEVKVVLLSANDDQDSSGLWQPSPVHCYNYYVIMENVLLQQPRDHNNVNIMTGWNNPYNHANVRKQLIFAVCMTVPYLIKITSLTLILMNIVNDPVVSWNLECSHAHIKVDEQLRRILKQQRPTFKNTLSSKGWYSWRRSDRQVADWSSKHPLSMTFCWPQASCVYMHKESLIFHGPMVTMVSILCPCCVMILSVSTISGTVSYNYQIGYW